MRTVRTDPVLDRIGYKVPQAASVGLGVAVIPREEMTAADTTPQIRQALGCMQELCMANGWTFPVASRSSNTYSTVIQGGQEDLRD